ncbi:MerR family transcriptional regulator [Streptomyces tateyamensis]|uniref:MerR family transcriptional regulator n=1 Tax=Streptomyces tateyamensis TaxID=565073 RepID=A0A2V4NQ02_9ACTN|nr:MerR family transcriptional regulator [Streptomyces tateyamensis]PYC78005.1 MerR family transcriptional regulator [Streptomyces tateyamensis]
MRIGELSKRTGVPVPTIKFYLREGLLPHGRLTSHNQAQYGEEHLHRIKLVRAMTEVGKLSVAAAREVLEAVDEPGNGVHQVLGVAQSAITPQVAPEDSEVWQRAEARVAELVRRRGWQVRPGIPAEQALVQLVVTFDELGQQDLLTLLDDYAQAAEQLAKSELAAIGRRDGVDAMVEGAVLGTVLGDALIGAMRRLAQSDASHRLFEGTPE